MNKEDHIYTVNELIQLMKASLEEDFGSIRVKGEISNLVRPSSGHLYFTIKDEQAQIKVAMFKSSQAGLRFIPADGMQVILYGRVSIYEKRGDLQVYAQWLEPVGKGALYLAFEQLKEKLRVEGLFDPAHKRPIPLLPRRVGVITSPTGAAIRDILNVSERRFANIRILLYPVRVQGREAPGEIAEAISVMNELNLVDVLIVGRGGGSLEDLWAFNEETVARAIFASKIPIISAVGHETDFTISDFVCDLRAPTPSAAAELVVKNKQDLEAR
ncbi:exodeoxyribonuclease VII large subunit, partial [bacterium]|nr:exodeoxyribonuclease VII large subunit [bacterium]